VNAITSSNNKYSGYIQLLVEGTVIVFCVAFLFILLLIILLAWFEAS